VDGNGGVFELNDYFNALSFGASGKVQERMLIKSELGEHAVQARIRRLEH
jgi:hypothetical protein